MSNRALVPLIVGLIVGLIAIKLTVDVVKKARAATPNEDLVRVVVAAQEIPIGVEIKESLLSVAKTSRTLAPKGIFSDVKDVVGRVTKMQIARGVPVIEEMLAPPGTPPGMASLLPPGYRAVAVRVDEFSSVGGFLKPGCRVDVAAVMTIRRRGSSPETISKVILQNVLVGAVGQSLTDEGETGANLSRSVTLILKPQEVPILHLAATRGRIRLALRHYEDTSQRRPAIATEAQLGLEEKDGARKKQAKPTGLLAALFKRLAGPARQPAKRGLSALGNSQQATLSNVPFVMMVMQGNQVETIAFENESSMKRLDVKKARYSVGPAAVASVAGISSVPSGPRTTNLPMTGDGQNASGESSESPDRVADGE